MWVFILFMTIAVVAFRVGVRKADLSWSLVITSFGGSFLVYLIGLGLVVATLSPVH